MSWKNESKRHSLAAKGIGSSSRFSGNPFDNNFNWEMDFDKKAKINYVYRCFSVGDEEQTQVTDNIPQTVLDLIEEGVSEEDAKIIYKALNAYDSEDDDYDGDIVTSILQKYITATKLVDEDWSLWEDLLFNNDYPDDIIDNLYNDSRRFDSRKDAEDYYKEIDKKLNLGYYN